MTFGLVDVSYSLPEGQAVKLTFFAPCRYTWGALLRQHPPVSLCTCQYTRGSVSKFTQFAPGACSQIFNRLNIVEHFAGWKFCSRGRSIPMKSLVHTKELCPWSMLREQNPSCVYELHQGTEHKLKGPGKCNPWRTLDFWLHFLEFN